MNVELITIGDELLLGFTIDTNAAHLARTLASIGVSIVRRATVGDDASEIGDAVREALDRTGALITTGGLGPTSDDRTRPAIAELFGRDLVPDEERWEALRTLWRERGRGGHYRHQPGQRRAVGRQGGDAERRANGGREGRRGRPE